MPAGTPVTKKEEGETLSFSFIMNPYWIISKIEFKIFNYRIRGIIIKMQTAVNSHICLIETKV